MHDAQRKGLAAVLEFIAYPARNRSPINNAKLKVKTKSKIEKRQAGTDADSGQKADDLFVSQHSSKPNVGRSYILNQQSVSISPKYFFINKMIVDMLYSSSTFPKCRRYICGQPYE